MWPATFGLACCAIELMSTGGPRHDLARFGMERASNTPRQADLMIVAGRVSQKMAPVLRQIYDQMADPKWVISMGVCASSGGMFNNYAIVQGVDHIVPVDIYLPGCPPRPEMLLDAILKLHDKIQNMKLGVNRERQVTELEQARLRRLPLLAVVRRSAQPRRWRARGTRRRCCDIRRRRERPRTRPRTRRRWPAGSGWPSRSSGPACSAPGAAATPPATAGCRSGAPLPLPAQRPYGSYFDEVADTLSGDLEESGTSFGDAVERVTVDRGELTFHVRRERLPGGRGQAPGPARAAPSSCAWASPGCTTRPTPAASCTPSTTCCRSGTTGGCGWRCRPPTPTRTSRR